MRAMVRLALALIAAMLCLTSQGQAMNPGKAAVIVVYSDGRTDTRCLTFGEPDISGGDLLTRTGHVVRFTGFTGLGAGVCAIDGDGCAQATEDCFCQCPGNPCSFWSYWHWRDGGWQYAQSGAGGHRIRNGDLDGWVWGNGQTPPSPFDFAAICPEPSATPTTIPPTPEPSPAATNTPIPPTAVPPPTVAPTLMPTAVPTQLVVPTATEIAPPPTAPSPTITTPLAPTTPAVTPEATATPASMLPSASLTPAVVTAVPDASSSPPSSIPPSSSPSPTAIPGAALGEGTATPTPTIAKPPESSPSVPTLETWTPRANSSPQPPLSQYATFLVMGLILAIAFWAMRRRGR